MEIKIDQLDSYMNGLFNQRDFSTLEKVAHQVTKQRPEIATAWRYLGIVNILTRKNGKTHLQQATLHGDVDAELWLEVLSEFEYYPKGTVHPIHISRQVYFARMRRSKYMDFPKEVNIETQAICNAACSFCVYPTMERKGDKMSDELIDKIIDDLKAIPQDLPFIISPFKVSDPFLDKRIFLICEKINNELPNAKLRLFTNGSPLTEKIVDKIADIKNVVHLWISLNEYEKNAYEATMKLPFEKTIEKLNALHTRVENGYPHSVAVSRVCDNSLEDVKFKQFLATYYPLFGCSLIGRSDWAGQLDIGSQKQVSPTACVRWYELSIMASGKVALCCMDGEGKHVVGDVNKNSVLEIYNSRDYRKMREYSFSRLAVAAPCDVCIY
ncbi:MAG: radical SAM/SPASM domain-containing protein [Verrucomicrobia bacterium]|nr:MAG: radical SAM/SPASM domain-containing protein [Verrucomicrobiota bacterium]